MTEQQDTVRQGIEKAVEAAANQSVEEPAAPVQPVEGQGPATPAPEPQEGAKAPESKPGESKTGLEPATPAVDEPPTEYFGVDLSDLPSEKRAEVIDAFKRQDRFNNRLQEKLAEVAKQQPTEPAPQQPAVETPAELSDEDLMRQLGYDPEDPMYDVHAQGVLPLARLVIEQNQAIKGIAEREQARDTLSYWNGELDRLEGEFGPIPKEAVPEGQDPREFVLDFAIQHNIAEPEDAYYRIVGPARTFLEQQVGKQRKAAMEELKSQMGGGTRPRGTAPDSPAQPLTGKVKEVFREAAKRAQESVGTTFKEALGGDALLAGISPEDE